MINVSKSKGEGIYEKESDFSDLGCVHGGQHDSMWKRKWKFRWGYNK